MLFSLLIIFVLTPIRSVTISSHTALQSIILIYDQLSLPSRSREAL